MHGDSTCAVDFTHYMCCDGADFYFTCHNINSFTNSTRPMYDQRTLSLSKHSWCTCMPVLIKSWCMPVLIKSFLVYARPD